MSRHATEVRVPCLYCRTWQDGFGARGRKLAGAAVDPGVIASTAATGERIPTSVFVHDILDHLLCGLGPSGHRNEAVALLQLAARTRTDPTPGEKGLAASNCFVGLGARWHLSPSLQ